MQEADLVKKIQELKKIKPRKDWVVLTKSQILGPPTTFREVSFWNIFSPKKWWGVQYKPAFATLIIVGFLVGAFGLAQNSLPGNFLYSLKKISEKSRAVFVSETERPNFQLGLVNKRLEELNEIAKTNQVENLSPALNEFQANISQAAEEIAKSKKIDVKKIVQQTEKLKENKQKIEALGVVVGESEELDNALFQLVEREIKDLENRTLTEDQEKLLAEAKEDFEAGNFNEALEKIWLLSNQP